MMRGADNRIVRRDWLKFGTLLCVLLAGCNRPSPEPLDSQPVLQSDRYDRAIRECDRVLEKNPRDARTYYERALLYYNKGQYDRAWQDVQRAQSLGYQVPPEFLRLLRETSQPNR